eukprot:TRINITY_DN5630_c0_g1_i10.p1 TRINITY_DN5630_c0_g1~~TRINITY_DN5630_c0_g1_i10.p1  ORF type:complete len:110 (+),score=6.66 TRINITY_DN5630_c0_g1_i10:30-359(+)
MDLHNSLLPGHFPPWYPLPISTVSIKANLSWAQMICLHLVCFLLSHPTSFPPCSSTHNSLLIGILLNLKVTERILATIRSSILWSQPLRGVQGLLDGKLLLAIIEECLY